jgi:hypothetical protein
MGKPDINTILVDNYFQLLKSLSSNDKLDLITRLSESMKTIDDDKKESSWESLFGAWELDQSTEEFIDALKKDRHFNIESIDL